MQQFVNTQCVVFVNTENPNSATVREIDQSTTRNAVADANRAIELDPSMTKAYLQKGIACLKLEEYQTAKAAFLAGAALAPGDSRFTNFIKECDERIAEENASFPSPSFENAAGSTVTDGPNLNSNIAPKPSTQTVLPVNGAVADVPAVKPKFRHEYYQKPEEVVVTIFAKGIAGVNVDYGEQILSATIDVAGEEPYRLQLRLFGKIIPAKCRYEVLSTKIEIRLSKFEAIHWTSLEFTEVAAVQKINVSTPVQRPSSAAAVQRPSYPSSKHKIDWDKVVAQVKEEEKDEKLDGDAAFNKLFQDIYGSADEDTQRAMQKSFVESNGTVLSTNWKEVGAKRVEGTSPDGLELKKWEH